MKRLLVIVGLMALGGGAVAAPLEGSQWEKAAIQALAAPRAELTFADVSSVRIDDAFWSPRYALWRGTTISDVLEKLETRSHVAANLELAAKGAKGGHRGAYFFDGLLCETLRGASDYLAAKPDAALEAKIDRFADLIAAAQRPDGYLNTRCQVGDGDKASFFYAKMFAFFFFWVVILPFSSVLIFSIMRSKHLLLNISSKNSAFLPCLHLFEKHFYCFFNRFPCWQRQSLYPSVWHPFHDHSLKLAHSPT